MNIFWGRGKKCISGWWFHIFSPQKLEKIPMLTSIFFQMDWFNHQPDNFPKGGFGSVKFFFHKNDDLCYLRDVRMLGLQAFLANMFYLAFGLGKNAYFRP